MDVSKIAKSSPSSNVCADLRAADLLSCPKVPTHTTSTIGYISPREVVGIPQVKRPTVSLILPASSEQMTKLETILSIDDTKRSSSVQLIEQKPKDLVTNKDNNFLSEQNDQFCICWIIHEIIQLICLGLFACLITMFIFTLMFYISDVYWFEQPMFNHSLWWFDNNDTDFTEFDYDMIGTTQTIDYNDEY